MDIDKTQRGYLAALGIGSVVASVPVTSETINTKNDVIGPVMLERVCDAGKPRMSQKDRQEYLKYANFRGCGTHFRWYLGSTCVCPECGRTYAYSCDDLHNKLYFVKTLPAEGKKYERGC